MRFPTRATVSLVPALLVLGACAQTPAETARAAQAAQATQDSLNARLAGLTPGEATSCLPNTVLSSQFQIKGYGSTVLYIAGHNLVYRNDTTGGCENISNGDVLVSRQFEGRACRGDIATTVQPQSRTVTGSCALVDFVPYRRAK